MDQSEIKAAVVNFMVAAVKVLAPRVLTWAAMLITAGMFGYALWQPDPLRIGTATIFAILVFWRVTTLDKGSTKNEP